MDRLRDTAIAVFDATWTMLDNNDLWEALTGDVPGRGGRPANLVWRTFTGEPGRVRHPDLAAYRASLVADLRDVSARYPADRDLAGMIAALRSGSTEFARLWEQSTVSRHGNERKTVVHPEVGELDLDCDVLSVHGAYLRIVVFTAAPGSAAADRLRLLTVLGTEVMSPT
jgi:hypothetical protein